MELNLKKHLKDNKFRYAIIVFACLIYFCVIHPIFALRTIDYDSSYQVALLRHSLTDICKLLPTDYSPPLYAFFSKIFTVFGYTYASISQSVFVMYLAIVIAALYPLRRAFGDRVSYTAALCFILSPANYYVFETIRPHTLGYTLVTISFIYACLVFLHHQKRDYILFTVFAVLSMYTHNVAMLIMLSFYIALLIWFLFEKKYLEVKHTLISGVAAALMYAPWLLVLFHQYNQVKEGFWSDLITFDVKTMLKDIFLLHFSDRLADYLMPFGAYAVVLASVYFICRLLLNKSDSPKTEIKHFLFILSTLLISISVYAFFVQFIVKIYAERYVYQYMGIVLIGIAFLMSYISRKDYFSILIVGLIAFNFVLSSINYYDDLKDNNFDEMIAYIDENSQGDVAFLHSHEWSLGTMMYYYPDARHYVTDDMFTVLTTYDVFPGEIINVGSPENIALYEDDFYVFYPDFVFNNWSPAWYYHDSEDFEYANSEEMYSGGFFGVDVYLGHVICN